MAMFRKGMTGSTAAVLLCALLLALASQLAWASTTELSKKADDGWSGTVAAGDTLDVTFTTTAHNLTIDVKTADTLVIWKLRTGSESNPIPIDFPSAMTWTNIAIVGVKITGSSGAATTLQVNWWRSQLAY